MCIVPREPSARHRFFGAVRVLTAALALGAAGEALAQLRGGFELAARMPTGMSEDEGVGAMGRQLASQGLEVKGKRVRDPRTNAVFFIVPDIGDVIEVTTPPLYAGQVEAVVEPFFKALRALGWASTRGGGHIHLDVTEFARNPTKFVNFLVFLHNEPLAQRMFLPVEGKEQSPFQMGKQRELLSAFAHFSRLREPSWDDVLRIFQPLFAERYRGIRILDGTVEIRTIANQKQARDARLQLEFFERAFEVQPGDRVVAPRKWTLPEHASALSAKNVRGSAKALISRLALPEDSYAPYVERYEVARAKGRRLASKPGSRSFMRSPSYMESRKRAKEAVIDSLRRRASPAPMFFSREEAVVRAGEMNGFADRDLRPELIALLKGGDRGAWVLLRDLDWTGDAEIRKIVLRAFEGEDAESTRLALRSLARVSWLGDPELKRWLVECLRSPDPYVLDAALHLVQAVPWRKDPALEPWVRRFAVPGYTGEPGVTESVRMQLLDAVPWWDNPYQLRQVHAGLNSLYPVEQEAARALWEKMPPSRRSRAHAERILSADRSGRSFPESYYQYAEKTHGCLRSVLKALRLP